MENKSNKKKTKKETFTCSRCGQKRSYTLTYCEFCEQLSKVKF